MGEITELLVVLLFVIVVPLWLILHYVTVWRRGNLAKSSAAGEDGISGAQAGDLDELGRRLEERLDAIETILDADAPGWREIK